MLILVVWRCILGQAIIVAAQGGRVEAGVEGRHKRGVQGAARGHVDHVILHPRVIFELTHVFISGAWESLFKKAIVKQLWRSEKFIAQMRH